MIYLKRALKSNLLKAQAFKVYRSSGEFVEGGWQEIVPSPAYFEVIGIVVPANEKELKQLPEADRIVGGMMFWSPVEIMATRVGDYQGTSDQLEWRGEKFKVVSVGQYVDYFGYPALSQRMEGA